MMIIVICKFKSAQIYVFKQTSVKENMKFSMTGQEKGGLLIQVTELLYFYKDNKMSEFHLLFLHKNNPENCL